VAEYYYTSTLLMLALAIPLLVADTEHSLVVTLGRFVYTYHEELLPHPSTTAALQLDNGTHQVGIDSQFCLMTSWVLARASTAFSSGWNEKGEYSGIYSHY